jgi:hypothetical protein
VAEGGGGGRRRPDASPTTSARHASPRWTRSPATVTTARRLATISVNRTIPTHRAHSGPNGEVEGQEHSQGHPQGQGGGWEPPPEQPLQEGYGLLEMHPNGYGFLRSPDNFYSRERTDPFVPATMIERFGLRQGLMIRGLVQHARKQQGPPPEGDHRRRWPEARRLHQGQGLRPADPH